MISKETNETVAIDNSVYTNFVGIKFFNTPRAYFFGLKEDEVLALGDKVVVETVRGLELGEVAIEPITMEKYESELGLKPIVRKANDIDLKIYQNNLKEAVSALEISKNEAEKLDLDMNFISCEYTLDKTKVIISYVADERVDFRELLKVLASTFRCRIELRQIGSRDKAKIVGGLGPCGMETCCSRFLEEFDIVSINMAKNQLLALNTAKLSGQCGKLMCCLKYEDENYKALRKGLPKMNAQVEYQGQKYRITSMNVLNGTAHLANKENAIDLTLEEMMPYYKKTQEAKNQQGK